MTQRKLPIFLQYGAAGKPMRTQEAPPAIVETVNYSGHVFSDFFAAARESNAPGYFVYGRNAEKYGTTLDGKGAYVMLCARPDVKPRKRPNYSAITSRGWRTKREAQAIADALNSGAAIVNIRMG